MTLSVLNIWTGYVKAPVSASQLPGTVTDPTPFPTYLAFGTAQPSTPSAPGGGGVWNVGFWQTANRSYYACVGEGPLLGYLDLGPGTYNIYVQVGDATNPCNGEIPVLEAGAITIK